MKNQIKQLGKVMRINTSSSKFIKPVNLVAQAVISALAITPLWLNAAEEQAQDKESDIEVLTVTAQKRVQNILKVPVSVGTVSASLIKETGSTLLADIDKFIPGFDFSDGNMTQAGITMRGITSPGISVGGDPSSATFYDDVYMPRAAQNILFSDMARIEVLKGPQGTLFGRNAAMGVVNMVPNAPHEDFEGFVKATLGSDSLQRYEAMINIPLTDNVYIRANGLSNRQDGFIENISEPSWNENLKSWAPGEKGDAAARIALLWDISDKTDFQISYEWGKLDQAPEVNVGFSEYAYNQGQTPFGSKVENDVRGGGESRDMSAVTAKFNHEFNNQLSMKYVASYREWVADNKQEEDGTADITRYFDTVNYEDSDIFYTELQFNYVNDKINAVAGFSYSKEDVYQKTELNTTTDSSARLITGSLNEVIQAGVSQQIAGMIGGDTDEHAEAAFGPGVTFDGAVDAFYTANGFPMDHMWNPNEWSNALNVLGVADDIMTGIGMPGQPLTGDIVSLTGDLTYDIVSQQMGIAEIFGPSVSGMFWEERVINTGDFTNWGIYGDIDYSITDKWNVIAGIRYSNDQKDFTWMIPENSFASVRPGVGNLIFPTVNMIASDEWSQTTGRLVTSYQVSDDDMFFLSYSTGYKSGGFDSLTPSQEAFEPEETSNLEFGYKGILWNQVVANVSAYYMELDNFQDVVDTKPPGNNQAIPTILNDDRKITGFELDVRWFVNDSVTLGLVSEIRSMDVDSPEFYNGEGTLIEAKTTSTDSALNYTMIFEWAPDFGVGTTNFHLDYQFVENINAQEAGLEDYKKEINAYFYDTKDLNARLSWANDDDTIEVGLWGKNLLDKRYVTNVGGYTAADSVFGTPTGDVSRGLEAGVDFKYSF